MLRFSTRATADTGVLELLAARAVIDEATTTLRTAEITLAGSKAAREVARTAAERLEDTAALARQKADEAAAVSFSAERSADAADASLLAAVGSGGDLLAGLGGMSRMANLNGDPAKLIERAKELDERADDAEEAAGLAWDDVDAVPVESDQQEVRAAEVAITQARAELDGVQTRVAAQSVELVAMLPADAGQLSAQGWAVPVTGRLTDGFGPRPSRPAGANEFHRGTDVAAACGTPVFAATAGVVVEARTFGGYGNWVLIDHGSGVSTGYAHLQDGGILVSPGEFVEAGKLIGLVGSTGASTGCHLHFEVRLNGVAVDARPFLAGRGIALG
ncbi:M23 family metallopeptidase [Agromyces sp. LHK192]|uniref:M23 family metallopeptidase n=1 Tax=Agromyces sp. LHK192 TaxID=2498704 RepID=UPI000FD99FF7|nr:M23 family metallopeptidase [Agromyces sp. LHK192]